MSTALMFLLLTIIILSFVIVNNVIFEEKDVVALNNTLIQPLSKPLSNNSLCTVLGPCTATTIPTAINSNSNGTFAKTLSNTTPNITSFHNPAYSAMNLSNNYNSPFPNTNSGLQALYIKQQNELLALVQKQQQEQTNFLQNQLQHLFGNTFSQQQQQPLNSTLSTLNTVMKNSNVKTINPIQR